MRGIRKTCALLGATAVMSFGAIQPTVAAEKTFFGLTPAKAVGVAVGGLAFGVIGAKAAGISIAGKTLVPAAQTAVTTVSAMVGMALGWNVGEQLDRTSKLAALGATAMALESGGQSSWANPGAGTSGKVSVTGGNGPCTDYMHIVTVRGNTTTAHKTACRNGNTNTWSIPG